MNVNLLVILLLRNHQMENCVYSMKVSHTFKRYFRFYIILFIYNFLICKYICICIIAAPMSFLMEQAGGLSLTGKNRIMVRII